MPDAREQRAALRELHQNATQGEWSVEFESSDQTMCGKDMATVYSGRSDRFHGLNLFGRLFDLGVQGEKDLSAAVAAHNALPGLLDDLDAAEAELLSLRVEISGLRLLIEQPNAAEKRFREALERIRDSRIDNYRSGTARNAALNELDWAQNIAKAALDEPETPK